MKIIVSFILALIAGVAAMSYMLGLLASVGGFIWLGIVGEYDVLLWGIGFVIFGFMALSFAIAPATIILMLISRLIEKVNKELAAFFIAGVFPFVLALASAGYTSFVFHQLLKLTSEKAIIPTLIVAFYASCTPWVEFAEKQKTEKEKENMKNLAILISFSCLYIAIRILTKAAVSESELFNAVFIPVIILLGLKLIKHFKSGMAEPNLTDLQENGGLGA